MGKQVSGWLAEQRAHPHLAHALKEKFVYYFPHAHQEAECWVESLKNVKNHLLLVLV